MKQPETRRRRRAEGEPEAMAQAIEAIYAAATDASLWEAALARIIAFVGNSGSHLAFIDSTTGLIHPDVHVGMPAEMLDKYNGERVKTCPRIASARRQPRGALCYDYQHITEEGIDHSEYYDWLQRKGDHIRYYLAAQLDTFTHDEAWLSLAFRQGEGHSESRHARRFRMILPHVNRAIGISQRLGTWEMAAVGTLAALGAVNLATFILDRDARLLQSNAAAEALLRQGDVVRLAGGRLQFRNPAAEQAFGAQLAGIEEPGAQAVRAHPIALRSAVSGEAWVATVAPLRVQSKDLAFAPTRAILFIERRTLAAPDEAALRQRHGLTPAEARLAGHLVAGRSPAEIAGAGGVSIHTVRAQLKALMQKTGARRQAALVRVLLEG